MSYSQKKLMNTNTKVTKNYDDYFFDFCFHVLDLVLILPRLIGCFLIRML